jgi:hypothetical protein
MRLKWREYPSQSSGCNFLLQKRKRVLFLGDERLDFLADLIDESQVDSSGHFQFLLLMDCRFGETLPQNEISVHPKTQPAFLDSESRQPD